MSYSLRRAAIGVAASAALALGSLIAVAPAHAALVPECTVTLTAPKTVAVADRGQLIPVDVAKSAAGQTPSCVAYFSLTLRRTSDNIALGTWRFSASSLAYQNGRVELDVSQWLDFPISGTYTASVTDARLNTAWADANGYDAFGDYPTFVFRNSVVDVRSAAKTSLGSARTLDGVKLWGTATRYDPVCCTFDWVPQSGRTVLLQKKTSKGWVTKKAVKSNSKGAFAAVIADAKGGTWRAQAKADAQSWSANSTTKAVAKKISGKAPTRIGNTTRSTSSWGRKVSTTFTGKVTVNAGGGYVSAPKNVVVKVQKRSGKSWKTVKTLKTNAASTVSFSTKTKGTYRFAVPATAKLKTGYSAARNW